MRRVALVLLLIVPILGSCQLATALLNPGEKAALTPAAKVYALQGEFNIILQAVASYNSLPRCSPTIIVGCSEQKIMDRVRTLIRTAKVALDNAKATVKAFPNAPAALVASAVLRAAVAQLAAYMVANNVQVET